MSQWAHEHPELVGTDADPWMDVPGHAQAVAELRGIEAMHRAGFRSIEQAEAASSHVCTDEDCSLVQGAGESCRDCGAPLVAREP